ncbi:putative diguanylate cyclase DgcE [Paraglaciecola mesophila]|uniref:histidine kinase n=1 Tax=Paraglaciecola mesophila TaxID=197222 RepID=A0A857JI24_9ALTE|nr:HAMP domain-containing sensor histidine kinase [Paraglaciecola mesophila]QHJ11675.1 putative diguanylate cyclase DgcE [Paraglaciecola mesophila]
MVKKIIGKFRERLLASPQVDLEHKDMFRLAMEHSGIGMALIAPDGTWLKVNQAICNIVGYCEQELLAIDFQTITHPEDLQADLTFLKQLLANDIQTYNMEKRYFHKSGSLIWAKLTVSLVRDEARQPLYFISQIQDITAQKKSSEALLLAKQEMEEFAYRITHDLRSPLSSMDYVMKMVANYINKGDLPNALKTVQSTQNGIAKLSELVCSVLDVSKIKLQDEASQAVDVSLIVYDTLEALCHMENFARLDIKTQFEYIGSLHTKPNKFTQIVDNFISNAIKYQDTSKANSFIRVFTYKAGDEFVLEVQDNGLGVPAVHRDKLFQMFERFHPKASIGTGLGLYMVKKSADLLGGHLSYSVPESEEGSIFRFSLPLPSGAI